MTFSRAGILKEILFSPEKAFSEIGSNGKKYFPIAFIILLGTAVSTPFLGYLLEASNFQYYVEEELPLDFTSTFFEIEFGFFFGLGFAALVYFFGKKLGGQGTFKGVFSSICYSTLPIVILEGLMAITMALLVYESGSEAFLDSNSFLIFSTLSMAFMTIMFASVIWGIILSVIAVMKSHQLRFGKSIGVLILAAIVILVIALPVLFLSELYSEIPTF